MNWLEKQWFLEHVEKFNLFTERAKKFKENGIVFLGDSFFDTEFWINFYEDVHNNAETLGLSASSFNEWVHYVDSTVVAARPKTIIITLGTNDLWNILHRKELLLEEFKQFITSIKARIPGVNIYYFSIINRDCPIPNLTYEETTNEVIEANKLIKEWLEKQNNSYFIDVFPHFTNPDGSCKKELFKDGCHPNNNEYHYYLEKLKEKGIEL